MFRQLVTLTVLVAMTVGCSKGDMPSGDPNNPGPVEVTDPNATYTIKLRDQQTGDKTDIVKTRSGSMSATTANATTTVKEKSKFEYTESVIETAPGEPRPTKVSRAYKVAEKADQKGDMHNLSYAAKTVTIEKYAKGYKITADGKSLPVQEQVELGDDIAGGRGNFDGMLPKSAVKVGEEWTVDIAAVKGISGKMPFEYHKEKSKITGKLVRAYKKDGQQWGVIDWKIALVFDTHAPNGSPIRGSLPSQMIYDTVIDGSARAGTLKITMNGSIDHRDALGHEVKMTIEGVQEQTFTPVK
ncbi:MAG: hypothetical protein K8U57_01245 [Planctomycetes bacterium]|nr:hypothetical protein [Planctomycetota bacterium]